uniref:Uncharacterized protein n=1 Tax=Rhizophora mucronata TaxID=61149 RepID=A0A2P2NB32_RHIMU
MLSSGIDMYSLFVLSIIVVLWFMVRYIVLLPF